MRSRLIWIGSLIIFGAAAALWFLSQRDAPIELSHTDTADNAPSVSFDSVEMIINAPDGKPQYRMLASRYQLYEKENRSQFDLPSITLYDDKGGQIHAQALQGETHDYRSVITLTGNVRINQTQSDIGSHPLVITTELLIVFPVKQRATTDSTITAMRGSEMFSARGMSLDLIKEVLYLHSNVEGIYQP